MKFKTGYIYHLATAILFAGLALYLWLNPGFLSNVQSEFRGILLVILLIWAVFRGINAWFLYKRRKREVNDE